MPSSRHRLSQEVNIIVALSAPDNTNVAFTPGPCEPNPGHQTQQQRAMGNNINLHKFVFKIFPGGNNSVFSIPLIWINSQTSSSTVSRTWRSALKVAVGVVEWDAVCQIEEELRLLAHQRMISYLA